VRSPRIFAIACILSLIASVAAHAAPIAFNFTGTVTDDPFGLSSFGAPISGSFTFDSAATDSIPDPSTGSFASSDPLFGFTVNVDGTLYSVIGSLVVNTANDIGGVDQYGAIALDGPLTLELFLQDATGTALSTDALPLVPPAFAGFTVAQFRLFGDDVEFLGDLTTLVCTAGCSSVPEPGALLLLLTAALAARFLRRRRADA
jgi:hypothetical protein